MSLEAAIPQPQRIFKHAHQSTHTTFKDASRARTRSMSSVMDGGLKSTPSETAAVTNAASNVFDAPFAADVNNPRLSAAAPATASCAHPGQPLLAESVSSSRAKDAVIALPAVFFLADSNAVAAQGGSSWAHSPRRLEPFDAQGAHYTVIRGDLRAIFVEDSPCCAGARTWASPSGSGSRPCVEWWPVPC